MAHRRELLDSNTMETVFGRFEEMFKHYQESKSYEEMEHIRIYFNSSMLKLDDTTDIERILEEINGISSKIFMYSVVLESQQMLVQRLEDEFERWVAERYIVIDNETEINTGRNGTQIVKKVSRTESAKDKLIIYTGGDDYNKYQERLRVEKYKLGLMKRVVNALDNYSYKLHSILNYRQIALQKGL